MNDTKKLNRFQVWFLALRPRTLPAAVSPVIVGTALAFKVGHFDYVAALLALSFSLLIQIGTNFANDYFDFKKGADSENRVGPKRVVAIGLVTPKAMRNATTLVFTAAFILGLFLVSRGGVWMIAVGVASILSGIWYTAGRYALAYTGLADIFVFIFFGLVAVSCTFYVQVGHMNLDAFLAAIPIGLLTTNILVVNNYRDMETDALAHKRTLVVRFGRSYARMQFAVSQVLSFVVPVYLWFKGYQPSICIPLLLIPLAFSHYRRLSKSKNPQEQIVLLGDTGKLLALYAITFSLGLVLNKA
jgi:1,4-dihydroxy-2-naphthoate octaprenyltransferase